jgi:hypothetical protein
MLSDQRIRWTAAGRSIAKTTLDMLARAGSRVGRPSIGLL